MAILFTTVVQVWNSKKPGDRIGVAVDDTYALNTNRITDLKVGADGSNFLFSDDPDDPRDSPGYIECDHGTAGIVVHHDQTPTSKFASLDLYPHLNYTGTPVTTMIEWADIAYAYAAKSDVNQQSQRDVCRIVYYQNDWKRKEAIVNMSLTAFVVLQTA